MLGQRPNAIGQRPNARSTTTGRWSQCLDCWVGSKNVTNNSWCIDWAVQECRTPVRNITYVTRMWQTLRMHVKTTPYMVMGIIQHTWISQLTCARHVPLAWDTRNVEYHSNQPPYPCNLLAWCMNNRCWLVRWMKLFPIGDLRYECDTGYGPNGYIAITHNQHT